MKGLGLVAILVAIVVGVAGSLTLDNLIEQTARQRTPQAVAHTPEYFFDNFTLTVMNEQGRPHYVLRGENLTRYRDDEVSEIQLPRLAIALGDEPDWAATADFGTLSGDGELVRLRGSVVLHRKPHENSPWLVIETESLDYNTETRVASTAEKVAMRSPGWKVDSTGMVAHIDQGLVELSHDVYGRWRPLGE